MKKLLLTMALLGAVFTVSACSETKMLHQMKVLNCLLIQRLHRHQLKKVKVLMVIQEQMRQENMRKSSMEYMNYIFQ